MQWDATSSERNPDYCEDGGLSVGQTSLTRFADLTVKVTACVMVGQPGLWVKSLCSGLIHTLSSVCHQLKGASCFPAPVAALAKVRV